MTEPDRFDLLADVARLIKKYGSDTFSDLAGFLRSSDGVEQLVSFLEAGSKAGRKARVTNKAKTRAPGLSSFLSELENKEPAKASQLSEFARALQAKTVLASLREIRDFAADHGLCEIKAKSRQKALLPLIRDLATRATDDLTDLLARIDVVRPEGDRTLDGWAGVILGKGSPGSKPPER